MMFPKKEKRRENPKIVREYADRFPICQICGSARKIGHRIAGGVHHIKFRSAGGLDEWSNLITLCTKCHTETHDGKISFEEIQTIKSKWTAAEERVRQEGRILTTAGAEA